MFTISSGGGVVGWLPLPAWDNEHWSWLMNILVNTTLGTVLATIFASFLLVFKRKSNRNKMRISDQQQAVEVGEEGSSVYKSALLKDDKRNTVDTFFPEVTTLYHAFLRGMEVSENGACLGQRVPKDGPYAFMSYAQVFKKSRDLGSAFITKLGLKPCNETHVGIYARNCPEWLISTLACVRYSMVVVPLYDTLGADAASFIIQHTTAEIVVAENVEKANKVLEFAEKASSLKHIVLMDGKDSSSVEAAAEKHGIKIHIFQDLLNQGESAVQADVEPKPEDTYLICYTSGTTGTPKGVMLSHSNVVSNVSAFVFLLNKFLPEVITQRQTIISYLPLSHVFEQNGHWCMLMLGGKIGYFSGDVGDLSADMQRLNPTIFPVVPRLLNRFNDAMKHQVDRKCGAVGKFLFHLAYKQKLSLLKSGVVTNKSIWDKVVFRKAQDQLGGKVNLIITGSAPINPDVLESCRVSFGAHVIEGYGQTESTALATSTWPGEHIGGHCGGPAVCSLIKLIDVPDLNYFAKDRRGEIMIKGPSITKGYYKDPEKTAELFDEDGFLHTGDVGHLQPNGTLKIIDRKKHIFKLAQGEYVAPEKIEGVYGQSSYVQQIYVDGDSLERYLVAIVVPMDKALRRLYRENHPNEQDDKSMEEICKDKKTKESLLADLHKFGKAAKLNSIEQVKKVHIELELFSVENGLLTPTMKSKRPQLRLKYKDIIKSLYKDE